MYKKNVYSLENVVKLKANKNKLNINSFQKFYCIREKNEAKFIEILFNK